MPDQTIKCADCKEDFLFTEGEQKFFQEKFGDDFTPPKRCKDCRKAKKERSGGGRQSRR